MGVAIGIGGAFMSDLIFLKSVAEEVGFYGNEKLAEDWNLWLKLGRLGKFYNFPDYFTYYTMDGNNK